MSDRPTPETDDLLNTIRKLECELAEAVKARDHNRTCAKRLTEELDEAREQIAKANSERENDTQSELAAWELLKETRELARELRDALELALEHVEPGVWIPDKSGDPNLERLFSCVLAEALSKAKEVLP